MTEGLIITKEGRVIALDDNGGIKEPIKSKDLEETMANENKNLSVTKIPVLSRLYYRKAGNINE